MKLPLTILSSLLLAGPMASGEVKLSEKLTRIASHLGEGGVHFSVTDTQDDLKKIGKTIDEFLRVIPESDIPPGLSLEKIFDELGLFSVQGSGESSKKLGEIWHNRSFVLTDGKHEGLLSLLGREAAPSGASDFAPAGADLVLETTLDLRQIEQMSRKMAKMMGPEAAEEAKGTFMEALPGMGMTLADFLTDFSVRGTLVFWLDEKEKFALGPDASFPVPHFAARMEGSEVLWLLLKNFLGDEVKITEAGDELIMSGDDGAEQAPWGEIEPLFVWNKKTKQLFFGLDQGDLEVCRGKGAKLSADADFKKATMGFPEKTNGLAYVSGEFLKTLVGVGQLFAGEIPEEGAAAFEMVMSYLGEVAEKGGYAGAFSVEKDGFLFVANSPLAMKGTSGLSSVMTVATLAGVATPLILRVQKTADDTVSANNLKNYGMAQNLYRQEYGHFAKSIKELVKEDFIAQEVVAGLAASGFENLVDEDTVFEDARAIMGFVPSQKDPDMVVVLRASGAVNIISQEAFMEQLRKQSE